MNNLVGDKNKVKLNIGQNNSWWGAGSVNFRPYLVGTHVKNLR